MMVLQTPTENGYIQCFHDVLTQCWTSMDGIVTMNVKGFVTWVICIVTMKIF